MSDLEEFYHENGNGNGNGNKDFLRKIEAISKFDNDLWKTFIDSYETKYGQKLPEEIKNIKNLTNFFRVSNEIADDVFDDYMKVSFKIIIIKVTNILFKSIEKFEKGLDNIDEKSAFVIIDKLSSHVRSLNEIYKKISNKKNEDTTSGFNEL